jgi:hypothetical protein
MMPPSPLLPNPANSGKSNAELIEEMDRAWKDLSSSHHDPNEPTPVVPYIIGAPDDDAPISQWKTLDVFDSAAKCKAGLEAAERKYAHDNGLLKGLSHARCIASDDPRLKEK